MRIVISCVIAMLLMTACHTQPEADPETEEWEVSALFQSGSFSMIGQEGKLGFIYDDSEAMTFYPDKTQKYMWHFWGEPSELQGKPLKVVGTSKETGEQIVVYESPALSGPLNGADAHIPSHMTLPSAGLWKLDAYIEDELFGEVVVQVEELPSVSSTESQPLELKVEIIDFEEIKEFTKESTYSIASYSDGVAKTALRLI